MTATLPPNTPAGRAREAAQRCESAGLIAEADILYRLAATLELEQRATSSASLARVLIASGAVEEARPFAVAGNDPVLMALLALETHDLPEARRLLDDARERDPFDPRSASARGRLSFFERRFQDSVSDLLEAALLRPGGLPDPDDFRFLRAARALASADFPGWGEAGSAARTRLESLARARTSGLVWPDRVPALVRALISRGARSEGLLDRARALAQTPGLAGIDDHALLAAAGAGEVRRVAAGASLYRAGEVAGEIYLVLSGAFELVRETPVGPQTMGSFAPSDFLGEECLVPGSHRVADARAGSGAAVLGFRPDFLFEGGDRAAWLRHLRVRLAQRLAALNLLFERFFPGASAATSPETPSSGEAASLTAAEKAKSLERGGLSESDRYLFGAFAQERSYPGEALIFREGDRGDTLYAVASGRVRISRHIAGGEEALAILGPGEIFGEMAILNPAAGGRSADARAHEPTVLLELGRDRFDRLEKADPEGAAELSAMLCRLAAGRCVETAERLGRWRIMAGPS